MVFNFDVVGISLLALFVWVAVVSFFLWQTLRHYNKLTKGVGASKNLKEVLEKILEHQTISEKSINELVARCSRIENDGLVHAQKIGLIRFNPFNDTGGDQSFVLAILDGRDNGVVISSLHGRAGSRWYAKTVVGGKGKEHDLSEEEKKAIKQARPV